MRPIELRKALEGLEGRWVAIRDGQIVAAGETPDAVYMHLHQKGERDATILRVPAEDEPEIVGFA